MWARDDTYAEVTSGSVTAEVLRFVYWDERDGFTEPGVTYEVRINGAMPEDSGGVSEVYATEPQDLLNLAAVCGVAAMLLDEVRQQYPSEVSA
jgi:hypothetical protein